LYMATLAKQQDRRCYLINFSSNIELLDLSKGLSSTALHEFLQKSFHGGTDVEPAIIKGIEIMETDAYVNADLLVISDMQEFEISKPCKLQMDKLRGGGNSFFGLCVEESTIQHVTSNMTHIFDDSWIYYSSNQTIEKLL